MDEEQTARHKRPFGLRVRRFARLTWLITEHLFDLSVDTLGEYAHIITREIELFMGVALLLLGLLNFQNGKNCDGNSADYLSCTRPSTFYYYNWFEITLIVIGVFLLLLWFLRRQERYASHTIPD